MNERMRALLAEDERKARQRQRDALKLLTCSFCGKSAAEVHALIAGPAVYICSECLELCVDIVGQQDRVDEVSDGAGI